jgi:CHAT domain-containing protein
VHQGRELFQAGQFSNAATVWQQAAQDYQTQGDELNRAMVLSNLSLAYQQLGQWPQATQAITASLQLLQTRNRNVSTDQLKILAQALNTQGSLQLAQGQAEPALATWQQAATTYAQARDDTGMTRSQINQAQALQALGLYRRALTTLTQVNQTLQKQPSSITKAAGLRSLGNALRVVGDLDKSQQVLQQSLSIAQQLKSPQEIGATLFSLGNTAQAQQNTQAALAFYQQAATASPSQVNRVNVQLSQLDLLVETKQWAGAQTLWPQIQSQLAKLPSSRTAIYAQINFAQSLTRLKQGNPNDAVSWPEVARLLATAVQQAKSLGDQRAEAYALGSLGGLYEQTRQWSSAQKLTQQALLLAQAINAPDIAYRWQWQLGRLLKAQADTQGVNSSAHADAIAAYTEAVSTLQSLRNDLVAVNPDVQFSFREEVEPVYRQLVDLLLQSERNAQPSQRQSLLAQARVVIESLQLAELNNFFRAACLDAQPVSIDQIVDQENPTTAVIYPIVLPDRLEIILKLPQQPLRHYTTRVDQKDVESTLEDLRLKLIKPYTLREVQSLSQQAHEWLVRPAEADLARSGIKTLVFVLDSPLRNVPMAILYDGQQYLVQKYGVALTPSLRLLDPKPLERRRVRALTAGLAEPRHGFAQLNYVESELAQIKSEVSSVVLLDRGFTEATLQNELNSSPFPVVHLATHGQFSSNADQTFILAWDKPIKVDELDQLLRRSQNNVNAIELLVLSACETAAGDKRAALGLAGVAIRAGARSTLASLWSLDDETSALLMSQFYQELAKTRVSKAEALRRAQLVLLQNPQYQHPRYWAPYVLVGNWL